MATTSCGGGDDDEDDGHNWLVRHESGLALNRKEEQLKLPPTMQLEPNGQSTGSAGGGGGCCPRRYLGRRHVSSPSVKQTPGCKYSSLRLVDPQQKQ